MTSGTHAADLAMLRHRALMWAIEAKREGIPDQGVPLGEAWRLLPHGALRQIIVEACAKTAAMVGCYDVDEEAGGYAITYRRADFEEGARLAVIAALAAGKLEARGFEGGASISSPRRKIPAERWATAAVDFPKSRVNAHGAELADILVTKGRRPALATAARKVAKHDARKWYEGRIAECKGAGLTPSEADDIAAAAQSFGPGLSRERIRELRAELAPEEWRRRGRKSTRKSAAG